MASSLQVRLAAWLVALVATTASAGARDLPYAGRLVDSQGAPFSVTVDGDTLSFDGDGKLAVNPAAVAGGFTSALAGKADAAHTHTQAQVTGLAAALAAKADVSALTTKADTTALTAGLATKADTT